MANIEQTARIYQDLASVYVQQGQAQMRDRFMVLAIDAMNSAGRKDDAEKLRQRLLQLNPHHLFKPYASIADALKSTDVKNYVEGLRRTYPPEKAVHLLESLRAGKDEKPAAPAPSQTLKPGEAAKAASPDAGYVIRFQEDKQASKPSPLSVAANTGPLAAAVAPPAAPRPTPPATRFSNSSAPVSWNSAVPELDRPEESPGAWVAAGLFWLLLAAALGVFFFTLGGPFILR
jgi:hypothetical protein